MIRDNLSRLRDDISSICRKSGRDPQHITLVGVTKYADAPQVKEAIEAGLTHIAENKVQEAQKKFPSLSELRAPVTKHMIGHLQSNKVKQALHIFDIIQSVDSVKLVRELDKQATKIGRKTEIFLQVNTSAEEQKYGFDPSDLDEGLEEVNRSEKLILKGLMTIAPLTDDENVIRRCFGDLRGLFDRHRKMNTNSGNISLEYLSMGMTNDYRIALEEGANVLRIGRAIFQDE